MPGIRLLKVEILGGLVRQCAHTDCDVLHTASKIEEKKS